MINFCTTSALRVTGFAAETAGRAAARQAVLAARWRQQTACCSRAAGLTHRIASSKGCAAWRSWQQQGPLPPARSLSSSRAPPDRGREGLAAEHPTLTSDAPPYSHHAQQQQQQQQQQQEDGHVGLPFRLQQHDPRLSPLLLPLLRRLCRQLRFLSLHPHLLAAVRPTSVAAVSVAARGPPRRDWHLLEGPPPADRQRAIRMAALLLQRLWGRATYFSPWRTVALLEADSRLSPAEAAAAAAAAACGIPAAAAAAACGRPAAAPPAAACGKPAAAAARSGTGVCPLPQLLTRVATEFVRKAALRQLSRKGAASRLAASSSAAAATAAAAAAGDGGCAAGEQDVTEALLAASRWLSVLQHHPLRVASVLKARQVLWEVTQLEAFEEAIQRAARPLRAATPAEANTQLQQQQQLSQEQQQQQLSQEQQQQQLTQEQQQQKQQQHMQQEQSRQQQPREGLLQLSRDLVDALAAERLRLLREGRGWLSAALADHSAASEDCLLGEEAAVSRLNPTHAELHAAANDLLPAVPQQQQQQQQGMQRRHTRLSRLTQAFRPVLVQLHSTGNRSCPTSSSSSSSSIASVQLRPGLVLLAHPFLADPFWRESVLLLTRVSDRGVEALILNRSCNASNRRSSSSNSSSSSAAAQRCPIDATPLQLLTRWRQQQKQQQQQHHHQVGEQQQQRQPPEQQGPEQPQQQQQEHNRAQTQWPWGKSSSSSNSSSSRSSSREGRWVSLLGEDPWLLLLLKRSLDAAAVGQATACRAWRMQQQQQRLHRELVLTLSRRALQALLQRPHAACSSSSSSSREGEGESSSVIRFAEGVGPGWLLHVSAASDLPLLHAVLAAASTQEEVKSDWRRGSLLLQQLYQQQQHALLLQWLASGQLDVHLDTQQQHDDNTLLRQLLQQVQQQQQQAPPQERSSKKEAEGPPTPFPNHARLGGPFEGLVRLVVSRQTLQQETEATPNDLATEPTTSSSSSSSSTSTSSGKQQKAGPAPGGLLGSCMQREQGEGLITQAEAVFLGRGLWGLKRLKRDLQEGLWLALQCTDTRVLRELIVGQCSVCKPPDSSGRSTRRRGGRRRGRGEQNALGGLCPQCDGRQVYRQLLAAADAVPNGFFQSAARLPLTTADELQRAAEAAWNEQQFGSPGNEQERRRAADSVQQMPFFEPSDEA
ncbi:hypothetical protein Efla_003252 [Eimeria flavescens]